MRKTALLGSLAALLLSWAWLRLELREQSSTVLLWALVAGVAPALPPRGASCRRRGVRGRRPGETLGSVWPASPSSASETGSSSSSTFSCPFVPAFHPKMHGLVLLGVVGFTLAVTLAVAARRPLLAGGLLVAGAGWPTTLLHGAAA